MSDHKEQNTTSDAEDAAVERSDGEAVTSASPAREEESNGGGQDDSVSEAAEVAQDNDETKQPEEEAETDTQTGASEATVAADETSTASSSEQATEAASDGPTSSRSHSTRSESAENKPSFMDSVLAYLRKIWPQLRRLLILEIKLCLGILRNMLAMPVAFVAMLLDLVQEKEGRTENFDKVIDLGRASEDKINLFRQEEETLHDESSVDAILKRAEDKLKDL